MIIIGGPDRSFALGYYGMHGLAGNLFWTLRGLA
jgi:hypothetical protein